MINTSTKHNMQIQSLTQLESGRQNFMTLTVGVPEETDRKTYIHWIFDVDRSGSMSSRGSHDQRTRLEHVQHTLINITEYLKTHAKETQSIHKVTIVWFSHETNSKSAPTLTFEITGDTDVTEYKSLITMVEPSGSTSIGAAIMAADLIIPKEVSYKTALVFMSDGQPTSGCCDHNSLCGMAKTLVDRVESATPHSMTATFIGYGTSEIGLMEKMAECTNSDYHCVESEEGAGVVYGEIAHNILNEQRKNVVFRIEGGSIYDFKTNKWTRELAVGNMASGSERVFHMQTTTPDELIVSMSYVDYKADQGAWEYETDVCKEVTQPMEGTINAEVEIYSIRQSVLELLSDARKWKQEHSFGLGRIALATPRMLRHANIPQPPSLQRQTNAPPIPTWNSSNGIPTLDPLPQHLLPPPPVTPDTQVRLPAPPANRHTSAPVVGSQARITHNQLDQDEDTTSYNELKMRLDSKLAFVKQKLRDMSIESKAAGILQMLTDDLFIAAESLDRPSGLTNIIARQTSQGTQRAYNTVNAADFNDDSHMVSASLTSPYAPPGTAACIRSISQPMTPPSSSGNCPSSVVSSPTN